MNLLRNPLKVHEILEVLEALEIVACQETTMDLDHRGMDKEASVWEILEDLSGNEVVEVGSLDTAILEVEGLLAVLAFWVHGLG